MTGATAVDLIQTVGVIAALAFTGYEVYSRKAEQQFRNYLDGISGFRDLTRMIVEREELQCLYDYTATDYCDPYKNLSDKKKTLVNFCDLIICLCESIWVAREKGWLPDDEWGYWDRWIRQLTRSQDFRWAVRWNEGDYDESFMNYLIGLQSAARQFPESRRDASS